MVAGGDSGEQEVDVWTALLPGQMLALPWTSDGIWTRPLAQLPAEPVAAWGGWPSVEGLGLQLEARPSGAAVELRLQRIVGDVGVHLTALWYPDEPWMARVVWSALPQPGVAWGLSATPLRLSWGSGEVWTATSHGVLAPAGSLLPASGTCTVFWPSLSGRLTDRSAATMIHAGLLWTESGG